MSASRNILVITYWSYSDALVQTYTLPYLHILENILPAGSKIILVTLERSMDSAQVNKVSENIQNYRLQLHPFGLKAMFAWTRNIFRLRKLIKKQEMDTIHCWCTPAGAIGYLLSRLTGKPLIIDSYEPHAEAMIENGTWKKSGLAFRILFRLEKKMSHHAKSLIACSGNMEAYARSKYQLTRALPVKPACVDLKMFHPSLGKNPELLNTLQLKDKVVCVYAGKLGGIYLDKEVFTFVNQCVQHWGNAFRLLLLTNTPRETIDEFCRAAGIDHEIVITRFVPHAEIPRWMGLGDFGLTPVKPVPTKKCCSPIKDGEYWALGLPVVITKNISSDSELVVNYNCGALFGDFSAEGSAKTVKAIALLLDEDKSAVQARCRNLAEVHRNFEIAEKIYRRIYS